MAPPSQTKILNNVSSIIEDLYLPNVVDNVFVSMPLIMRMLERENVVEDGGDQILQPIIYDEGVADAYVGLEAFDTSDPEVITDFVFDWRQYYANITMKGIDALKSATGRRVISLVEAKMRVAEMTLKTKLATDLFGDGTRRTGIITGLQAVCDDGSNVTSYGGISRTTGPATLQAAAESNLDAAGGALTLDIMQSSYGVATISNEQPDIILTTQTLFNKLWARVQPQQRFPSGSSDNSMARVGFNTIRFNNADVVVDNHCPSGEMYFLNTNYLFLVIHKDENFAWTGWKEPTDQNAHMGQILFAGELVCSSPRLQARATGLT